MKVLNNPDIKAQIAQRLINGESVNEISEVLGITTNKILKVFSDKEFGIMCYESFSNTARGLALVGLHNISRIAFDVSTPINSKLKANKILVDIAREMQELNPSDIEAAHMTQNQLIDTLKALEKERIKRAKPIDTGVIEHASIIDVEDML